jgi:hypothetical protein
MPFEKRIHSTNIFYKEIEMKWSKLRKIVLWVIAIKILQSYDVK